MAQERNDQDLMHYEALAQEALRGVVKAALKRAASPGGAYSAPCQMRGRLVDARS